MTLQTQPVTLTPRFGTPGNAALFVGCDLFNDYFYFPLSQVVIAVSEKGERLLTQFEETAFDAAQYDYARELFELAVQGEVIA